MTDGVIWERTVDHQVIADRKQRFIKQFSIPAVVILLVVLVFAGWPNALGAALVVGLIGLAWGNTVRYKSLSDQANPTIAVRSGKLIVGNREVLIDDVKRFTTVATAIQTSLLGRHSEIHVGKAVFRLDVPGTKREPQLVEFGWPNMTEAGLVGVKAALDQQLPERWVEPTELVDSNELPTRRRPRSL